MTGMQTPNEQMRRFMDEVSVVGAGIKTLIKDGRS